MNKTAVFLSALTIGFFTSVQYTPSETLTVGTKVAYAGSCDFISNNDLKLYCQGRYDFISNNDLKLYGQGRCDFISNKDLKLLCQAGRKFPGIY